MLKEPGKNDYNATELELDRERAKAELEESLRAEAQREYQRMVAAMRDQVLNFIAENPKMPVSQVAENFGIREHTIRAWKAHRTMGTYQKRGQPQPVEPDSEPLFNLNKKIQRKRGFVLRKRHTAFIHYFDKTPPGIICPHFHILAFANGCVYQCQYCYLNLTLRHWPDPTVFSNTARMFQEIREWLLATREPSVLNAGELSDSLVWDREIKLTQNLVPLFAGQKKHQLLLLTKSANIFELIKLEPTDRVIVSFSVNAPAVSAQFEQKAPGPEQRLAAASALKNRGWRVRLRLDPVLPVADWKSAYQPVIDEINAIAPETVTLGSLRFFPHLRSHSKSGDQVFDFGIDENDPDGRWRIPFEIRREMYSHFIRHLKISRVGLCKETLKMHKALGIAAEKQCCNCSYD